MSSPPQMVSNAGPLMVLAKLHLLHLLHLLDLLYGRVRIARSVYEEAVVEGLRYGHEDAKTLRRYLGQVGWQPEDVPEPAISDELREAPLDRGERETIALALSLGDAWVLMDENAGRRIARAQGLTVRGSLGVLIEAYRHNLIDANALRLCFAEIAHRQDIWISPDLVERLLHQALGQGKRRRR